MCTCSVRLAPRATHTTCLDVADIEGTHPTSKDRAQLYAARKGAAAATSAQQAAVEGVLSELQLKPRELLLLWNECSTRDRDRSGLLTGEAALQPRCIPSRLPTLHHSSELAANHCLSLQVWVQRFTIHLLTHAACGIALTWTSHVACAHTCTLWAGPS